MSDRTEFLHPDFEPGEFDRIERELRRSLSEESHRVRPADRLDTILHEAHRAGPVTASGGTGVRRWLVPAAAAAVVAAIAGGVWLSNQDPSVTPGPPVGQPSATAPAPSASATDLPTTPSPSSGSPTSAPGATSTVALPVYVIRPFGGTAPTYKLFREFVPTALPSDATVVDRMERSLALAMEGSSTNDQNLHPWSPSQTTVTAATVTTDGIEIRLSGPGGWPAINHYQPTLTSEDKRIAVQQLVWTAQAAVGRGNLPVRFQVEGDQKALFGTISTDQPFTRPPADESWKDLAPVWVTSPSSDQVLPSTKSVTVQGEASVFEATVSWELRQGQTLVEQGHAMATIGAPSRGTYSFSLGTLPAGTYTVKAYEASAKDGSIAAEDSVTFTVK